MSVLINEAYANPMTPLWASPGGGGGVTSIIAGAGISVDTPTGNVTITNTGGGGTGVETHIGEYPSGANIPTGVDQGDTITLGTIDPGKFYSITDNFYTVGVSIVLSGVTYSVPTYEGNITVGLGYLDGSGSSVAVSTQSVYIAEISNDTATSQYGFSLTIGFKAVLDGVLQVFVYNGTTEKIADITYGIGNCYSVDQGPTGQTGDTIFV
jgi:hypothetical protein